MRDGDVVGGHTEPSHRDINVALGHGLVQAEEQGGIDGGVHDLIGGVEVGDAVVGKHVVACRTSFMCMTAGLVGGTTQKPPGGH